MENKLNPYGQAPKSVVIIGAGIGGNPVYSKIIRWAKAIPRYNLGYFKVLNAIDRFEANFSGAFMSGNFRGGIAVGDCIMNAVKTVQKITHYLNMI